MDVSKAIGLGSPLWAQKGSYSPRQGNEIQILIDGQSAYRDIAAAFTKSGALCTCDRTSRFSARSAWIKSAVA